MGQGFSEFFPPKSKFMPDDMPDLSGKITIVTGGNTGIGKTTCKYLLAHNAKVYMASRSQEKAESAIAELKKVTGKDNIYFLHCDLADLVSVKEAAKEFTSKETSLHILFNNAGLMAPPMDQFTRQGFDIQFGTNVIGHAYFTMLLLPTLLATAKATPEEKVRVVNTSSNGHTGAPTGGIDWESLTDTPKRKKMSGVLAPYTQYFQSKWGNVVFAKELARRYGDQGIVSTSLNPGAIRSDLWRFMSGFQTFLMKAFLNETDPYGALTQLYAGTAPAGVELNGKYLIPWARVGVNRPDCDDPAAGKKLWEYVEDHVKDI